MQDVLLYASTAADCYQPTSAAITPGEVVDISADGEVWVEWAGSDNGPVAARVLQQGLDGLAVGDTVIVWCPQSNVPQTPVVLGILADRLRSGPAEPAVTSLEDEFRATETGEAEVALQDSTAAREAIVDGKTIRLEAADEIVLRCGKSSITLRKNGKILVKGAEIVSRATRSNRIKGGSVAIN